MSKKTQARQPITRSRVAQAAWTATGAGPQAHRSTNRNRTRSQQARRAIKEQTS